MRDDYSLNKTPKITRLLERSKASAENALLAMRSITYLRKNHA